MNPSNPRRPGLVVKNAVSQMGGRVVLTGLRFLIVVIITNQAGAGVFGEYALLFSLLLFADVLVDFGMTDVVVRTLSREPPRQAALLGGLLRAKLVLTASAVCCLLGSLIALGYSWPIVAGGLAAIPAVASYGGVLVFRAVLKSTFRMQREVLAEIVGVALAIPLFWVMARPGATVAELVACHSLSRLVLLAILWSGSRRLLGKIDFGTATTEARELARWSYPLGVSLLLVCVYDALDPVILSQYHPSREIGLFSAPMRFIALVSMVAFPVADSALPLMGSYWKESRERFRGTVETTLRLVTLVAGLGFCVFFSSAEFLLGLLGPEMASAAGVLRILAFVAVGRTLMSVVPPVIIAAGGIRHALWLAAGGVLGKLVALSLLVPAHGALGAALANVIGEVLSLLVSSWLIRYLVGFQLPWQPLVVAVPVAAFAVGAAWWLGWHGSFLGGLISGFLFLVLAIATGIVPAARALELAAMVRQRLGLAVRPVAK